MKFRPLAYAIPLLFLAIFFLYPLAAILRLSLLGAPALPGGGAGLAALAADPYYLGVIWFSTWQALLSTALTLAIGLPAAYVFARYRFPGKIWLRAIATVPFVMPTVVVAAAFKALLGPRGLLNALLQPALGLDAPDPHYFCEDLARAFDRWLAEWRTRGLDSIREAWMRGGHPIGTALRATLGDGATVDGLFDGLDSDGALRLRLADGSVRVIHAADVFLI